MKLLFNNGGQHVSRDGAPDLRLYCVLAVADETLDAQMLLDPLEEQLDLPAALVKSRDGQRRQGGIVGQEHQRLAGFRVLETDAAQQFGIGLCGVEAVQRDALIADDAGAPIGRHRIHPARIHAAFGAGHEEGPRLMQREQATEIQITPIHHVERAGFDGQHIQYVDLVGLAVRDVDEGWDVAAKVEQRMQLDCRLGRTERSPREQRQAQVDGRGIQGVDRIGKVDAEAVVAVQLARTPDEQGGQIRPDAPVASLVGIGQRRAPDRRAKAHAVQLRLIGQQTGFDIAQALAVSQLSEGHGTELFGASQTAHSGIAAIARHDPRKAGPWHELHELCEQRLAQVHCSPPEGSTSESYANLNRGKLISNRHQNKSSYNPRQHLDSAREFVS